MPTPNSHPPSQNPEPRNAIAARMRAVAEQVAKILPKDSKILARFLSDEMLAIPTLRALEYCLSHSTLVEGVRSIRFPAPVNFEWVQPTAPIALSAVLQRLLETLQIIHELGAANPARMPNAEQLLVILARAPNMRRSDTQKIEQITVVDLCLRMIDLGATTEDLAVCLETWGRIGTPMRSDPARTQRVLRAIEGSALEAEALLLEGKRKVEKEKQSAGESYPIELQDLARAFRDMLSLRKEPGALTAHVEFVVQQIQLAAERKSPFGRVPLAIEMVKQCIRGDHGAEQPHVWNSYIAIWKYACFRSGWNPDRILKAWGDIVVYHPTEPAAQAWLHAAQLHLEFGSHFDFEQFNRYFSLIVGPGKPSQMVREYLQAVQNGDIQSPTQSFDYLKRLAAHAATFALEAPLLGKHAEDQLATLANVIGVPADRISALDLQDRTFRRAQAEFYAALRNVYSQDSRQDLTHERVIPRDFLTKPAHDAFLAWRRVADIHSGFGALKYSSKRTPDGEWPALARFGQEMGTLRMLNARDSEHFPGKGFLITQLDPYRIFTPDTTYAEAPFTAYESAWPGKGKQIPHLPHAEFIFTRGIQIVSCSVPHRYDVRIAGQTRQVALVVFNGHFRNPQLRVARLVEVNAIKKALARTAIPADDYRGYDEGRPDLNSVFPEIDSVLESGASQSLYLDVGDPRILGHGLFGHQARRWEEHLVRRRSHAEAVRANHEQFVKLAQLRTNLHLKFPSPDDKRKSAYLREKQQQRKLTEQLTGEELRLSEQANKIEQDYIQFDKEQYDEDAVWTVMHRLMGLYDLFKIALSYHSLGYTVARDGQQNKLFALEEMYRFHSQRAEGVTDRARFPVLVIANALDHALGPIEPIIIDSFDNGVYENGKLLHQLTAGEMRAGDQFYYTEYFLPRARNRTDTLADIRLVDRESIGWR